MANALISLESPTGKVQIVCNEQVHGPNRHQFLGLAEKLLIVLQRENPQLQVLTGFPKLARLGIAISGAMMALFGLIMAASASSSSRDTPILILGLGMAAVGAAIIMIFAPWKESPSISIQ